MLVTLLYMFFIVSIFWLVAIFKVFILDDDYEDPSSVDASLLPEYIAASGSKKLEYIVAAHNKQQNKLNGQNKVYISHKDLIAKTDHVKSLPDIKLPKTAEWLYIRSSKDYKIESKDYLLINSGAFPVKNNLRTDGAILLPSTPVPNIIESTSTLESTTIVQDSSVISKNGGALKNAHQLSWPPVLPDGSMPVDEGEDVMPLIGLKVPRFWEAPPGSSDADINHIGRKVNGQETIFLMIASYRDFQCRETITSAYMRSDHPERLFIGAVDQTVPGDIGCLDIEIPCSQDSSQPICKYRSQISIYHMDAKYATGPVTARHVGDRMYRGESFVMQMDAHCQFVRHWDTKLLQQWRETGNEMAVLSSYLTDVQGSFTPLGDSTRNTRPIMCNSDYEGAMPARYLRHGAQPECEPEVLDMPQLQPFWAAGFSFSRGHFKVRVPYDAYQPMVFQGEEIAIGIRGFTFGYDFYAPRESVVFHEYAVNSQRRHKVHMFWENSASYDEKKSYKRGTAVIGMAPDLNPNEWDHSELDRYGVGTVRDLKLFYKIFLIDAMKRKAVQLCPFVKSALMHRSFQPFLRSDGIGIDYSKLEDFNTRAAIDAHLEKQHPEWIRRLNVAIQNRDRNSLQEAIASAEKIGLDRKNPELVNKAREILLQL